LLDAIFPQGLSGKRFLDCACNAGGYCFWARERNAEYAFGFDVRDHWIRQGKFVQQYRTVAPTDRVDLRVMDLYDLPQADLLPFDLTLFSGIFYHLPDPITGLKIAADLTRDIIIVNTAIATDEKNPTGLTMAKESAEKVMSGVYQMAWFPNGPETLRELLRWMGFAEIKITFDLQPPGGRRRVEVYAARERNRLNGVAGTRLL
jgi:SAM-dependent methyltransferase